MKAVSASFSGDRKDLPSLAAFLQESSEDPLLAYICLQQNPQSLCTSEPLVSKLLSFFKLLCTSKMHAQLISSGFARIKWRHVVLSVAPGHVLERMLSSRFAVSSGPVGQTFSTEDAHPKWWGSWGRRCDRTQREVGKSQDLGVFIPALLVIAVWPGGRYHPFPSLWPHWHPSLSLNSLLHLSPHLNLCCFRQLPPSPPALG